ncbi:MAG TPA: hypothetical protein VL991_07295 [Terracidiphilus sp.]|nr:hypothetical protein [Terracidiphilus sp.]
MRRAFFLLTLLVTTFTAHANAQSDWKAKLNTELPLLGHRNWILIVDSAYPLQVSPGVETIDTNDGMIEVVQTVLRQIDNSIHVRPDIFMDAELPYVSEDDVPGVSVYRRNIADALHDYQIQPQLHDKLISQIAETGQSFHVLVLKTRLTIPYSSVFIRLNCKYWPTDAETRLRAKMSAAKP